MSEFKYAKVKGGSKEILKMTPEHFAKSADELTEVKDGAAEYEKQEAAKKQRQQELKNKMATPVEQNKASA